MTRFFTSDIINRFDIIPKEQTEYNRGLWEKSVKYSEAYFSQMKDRTTSNTNDWPYESVDLLKELGVN